MFLLLLWLLFNFVIFACLMLIWGDVSRNFDDYLRKVNYTRWQHLTSVGLFGTGNSNPFRSIPYLFSDQDNSDENIRRYKLRVRRWMKIVLCYIVYMVASVIVVFLIHRFR